jgi:cell division septal protein FtsQ
VIRYARNVGAGLLTLLVAAAVYAATIHVRAFLYDSDFFRIDSLKIEVSGASDTLRDEALERVASLLPEFRNNLFRLDAEAIRAELAALPRVREAAVFKAYPQGLRIRFVERRPLALVNLDRPFLIDRDGILLAAADPREVRSLGLPVLTGIRAQTRVPGDRIEQERLDDVLRAIRFIREHDRPVDRTIAEWNIDGMQQVTAILHGGAPVRFGEEPPLALLDKFSAAIGRKPRLVTDAKYIDLRMDRQVVYMMKEPR